GGAALSSHGVTGVPMVYLGTGERPDALEPLDPARMAGRILGQGDVVALVEKAAATIDRAAAEKLEKKARSKQGMDLQDFLTALKQAQQMGPLQQLGGLMPGVSAEALQVVAAHGEPVRHVGA